jgi:hypothetical protein
MVDHDSYVLELSSEGDSGIVEIDRKSPIDSTDEVVVPGLHDCRYREEENSHAVSLCGA